MGKLLAACVVAVALWSGWWWIGATGHQKAWELWLQDRQAAGWTATRQDISVAGYPNRIDTTLTGLHLADPVSGWSWTAPIFQILSLSYRPNHVIAVWPGTQTISTADGTTEITASTMRGSLVFVPDTDLTLDRMQLELADVALEGPDWAAALASANVAFRRSDPERAPANSYDFALSAADLGLPRDMKRRFDPTNALPGTFDTAQIDLTIAYDGPWDRHAVEGRKPQPTALSVRKFDLTWGKLHFEARGRVDIDRAGYPTGNLTIQARNWRDIITLAQRAGWLTPDLASQLTSGLQLLANLSGDTRSIDIPLSFADQQTRLGPLPLGPAPRLRSD